MRDERRKNKMVNCDKNSCSACCGASKIEQITVETFHEMKKQSIKTAGLTGYDSSIAGIEASVGNSPYNRIDWILVGDSAGNTMFGYGTTTKVTMDEMKRITGYVRNGLDNAVKGGSVVYMPLLVGDMPINTYDNIEDGVKNAKLFMEAGANAIKLEGGTRKGVGDVVESIVKEGIPVMGHIGFTPQTADKLVDESVVQGKTVVGAKELIDDALYLQDKGAFAVLLECTPWKVTERITNLVEIPIIGIGAGPKTDGQLLIIHDLINLTLGKPFKFVWQYPNKNAAEAIRKYAIDVKKGAKPTLSQSFKAPAIVYKTIKKYPLNIFNHG